MPLKDRWGQPPPAKVFRATVSRQRAEQSQAAEYEQQLELMRTRIQDNLVRRLTVPERADVERLRAAVAEELDRDAAVTPSIREALFHSLVDEMSGYGPIQPLLGDPAVTEIMVNGPYTVYVERQGVLQKVGVKFRDETHLNAVLEKMLAFSGRRIDESSPLVDARLPDGSRLNAVVHPISVRGTTITIRKFAQDPWTVERLVENRTLSPQMAQYLQWAVQGRLNVVIAGGTASGKTTTLNAISAFIGDAERIVSIEDAAELRLQQSHWVALEGRPANVENRGEITIRTLVRNALRMRPDRIIVGEVRGAEALDMLQAMNTGHEGSLTTLHANSSRDALNRLETMVLMSGLDLPLAAVRQQIASAIQVVVHQARLVNGARRVLSIAEVSGMEEGNILMQDVFRYRIHQDQFEATGVVSQFLDRMRDRGVPASADLFQGEFEP
jgi:pilus assembly protein CpaF